jgi:coenzyme F420-reducing hydrogenase gamma subunit
MPAHVAVISLASDFGCQVQITNLDDQLLAVLGQFELSYWQLASSGHLPEEFDVAVIEGAVTTAQHVELLKRVRATASTVILIGACAVTGGIPGLAADGFDERLACVYGDDGSLLECVAGVSPRPVDAIIDVDYRVPGCPIQPAELVAVLQRALMGLADRPQREPMCASCKVAENQCFYERGVVCLGMITRSGCGAKCVSLGRPCTGCRGIAEDANLEYARQVLVERGLDPARLATALQLYNSLQEAAR